jgi:hypothetical protein
MSFSLTKALDILGFAMAACEPAGKLAALRREQ